MRFLWSLQVLYIWEEGPGSGWQIHQSTLCGDGLAESGCGYISMTRSRTIARGVSSGKTCSGIGVGIQGSASRGNLVLGVLRKLAGVANAGLGGSIGHDQVGEGGRSLKW
ncbi:hypothetical protein C8R46DRAFT_1059832 [Mycena filopes]|nr:hypothetical protein C8R46DRAFT_1059832 [Mycena filopes]